MRGDITISDSHRKTLDIINRSGEHLLNLINDVLDVARIEAGKVELAPSACDLGEMMRDITDMIHQRAEEKGLQLIFDQTSNFPRFVSIDGGKLRQVLINLINNAVKYTEHGMVSFRIDATDRTDARTTTLTFEIRDTGPGISIEDQKHVFEPFVQVGDPQARKGTGLGLTITRQYIELMGGTISLDSVLGEGSCFSVTIPVELSTESEIVQASGRLGRVTGLEEGQPEYRILIVDDQPENSLLLRCLLEPIGLKVRIAENGSKAVHIFDEWRPHFIWMDRQMPVMDGLDATKAIRKLPGGGDTIIVCLTASAFMEQRKESLMAGMDDFMSKPYHADEIYDSMAKHLGLKYIYDEEKKAPQISSKELGSIPASALDTLSEDLLSRLSSAILTLDTAMIGGVITEISEQDSTAGELLTTHMERLSYTTILQALDERSKRVIPGKKAA
jgi:CheY-like chemotaxis protein